MYVCGECGEVFDSPDVKKEYTGVSSEGFHEYFEVGHCPYCGSEDIEDGHRCRVCGEWFYQHCCEEVCESCIADLRSEMDIIQNKHGIDYETLQEWIAELFGW